MDAFVTNKPIRPGSIQLAVGRGIENEEAFLSTLLRGQRGEGKERKKGGARWVTSHEVIRSKEVEADWPASRQNPIDRDEISLRARLASFEGEKHRGSRPSLAPRKINR